MAAESKLGIASIPIRATMKDLDKDLSEAREKVAKATDGIAAKLGTIALGGIAVGAAAAAAVAGIGMASIDAAEELDGAFDAIAIGTGATGNELKELQEHFKNVFADFPGDAETAATTLSVVSARLQATGDDLEDMTSGLLDVSRLLGTDAAKSAELFARVLGDWNIENEHGAETLDMLFTAVQETGAGLDDLMRKVVQFGAPLRLMGSRSPTRSRCSASGSKRESTRSW